MEGIATGIGCQHREAGNGCLQQNIACTFVIGRVQEQIAAEQKIRHIIASTEKAAAILNAELAGKTQEAGWLVLADDQIGHLPP